MAEFDFAGWVARARGFAIAIGRLPGGVARSTSVTTPIAESAMQAIEGALGVSIGTSLRALFTRGAAARDCAYSWAPEGRALDELRALLPDQTRIYGGAKLGPVSELERLCHIGPEHWLIAPFTDDDGYLDAESERAARLPELLGR
jgi:hypothetical protein